MCKIASSFRTTRPATRGIAIDWTAWGGIGMATRGSIPKMMARAGIDMLPPEAGDSLDPPRTDGGRHARRGGRRGRLGIMTERVGRHRRPGYNRICRRDP
jgi:hypothetical protein